MILITGGFCQGKYSFARSLSEAEGEELEIVKGIEEELLHLVSEDGDWEGYVRELMKYKKDAVIILREMGCGVVPIKKEERIYRDICGKAGQMLAKNSEEVYRVICGIGTRIK